MKLAELGLKTKPATKYFEGGYIKFHTDQKELWYQIVIVNKKLQWTIKSGLIGSKEFFTQLMNLKDLNEVIRL